MYLLFLGVVKTYIEISSDFMKREKRWFRTEDSKEDSMSIIANYDLYWIPLITAKQGWVSENYLGYSRLIKWYYMPMKLRVKGNEKRRENEKKLFLNQKMTGSLFSMLGLIWLAKRIMLIL